MFFILINFKVKPFIKSIDDFYFRLKIRLRSSYKSSDRALHDLFVSRNFKNTEDFLDTTSEGAAAVALGLVH